MSTDTAVGWRQALTFGTPVEVHATVERLRTIRYGRWDREAERRVWEEDREASHELASSPHRKRDPRYRSVKLHGGRYVTGPHPVTELEVLAEPYAAGLPTAHEVRVVRFPLDEPLRGVVVGHSRRYAGTVRDGDAEVPSYWTNAGAGSVEVVVVALNTDGAPKLVDVRPADARRTG